MNSDFQKAYILSRIQFLNLCPSIPHENLALNVNVLKPCGSKKVYDQVCSLNKLIN